MDVVLLPPARTLLAAGPARVLVTGIPTGG
ncbi:MAG: hypothetical protein QOE59_2950 [Actinomycetota bacterium]|jgi:hypothetical protein|nr:hypothetical protein [Actinomycetota bacterium]